MSEQIQDIAPPLPTNVQEIRNKQEPTPNEAPRQTELVLEAEAIRIVTAIAEASARLASLALATVITVIGGCVPSGVDDERHLLQKEHIRILRVTRAQSAVAYFICLCYPAQVCGAAYQLCHVCSYVIMLLGVVLIIAFDFLWALFIGVSSQSGKDKGGLGLVINVAMLTIFMKYYMRQFGPKKTIYRPAHTQAAA